MSATAERDVALRQRLSTQAAITLPAIGGLGFEGIAGDSRSERPVEDGGQSRFACHTLQQDHDYASATGAIDRARAHPIAYTPAAEHFPLRTRRSPSRGAGGA